MSRDPPGHLTLPPPSFPQGPPQGANQQPLHNQNLDLNSPIIKPRVSFGYPSIRRFSYSSSARRHGGDLEMAEDSLDTPPIYDLPPIPSALPKGDSTPLPMLPMIVLSISMLGEFLSANVSTPFLLFMVEGFGVGDGDESKVGYLTGILVSMFFITQFITSILWAAVADKHGRRAVLFISLLGNALTCLAFGTATTFPQAVAIRLMQGIFNGSVGVARGAVSVITDPSNEARAYATIGFCWGLGGVAGAVIGGAFERPAVKWPEGIGAVPLFVDYPYLLPCAIASSITFVGSILSLFLGWDGGPREGLIRLEEKGEEEIGVGSGPHGQHSDNFLVSEPSPSQPETVVHQITSKTQQVSKKLSGYFARRVRDAHRGGSSPGTPQGGTRPSTPSGQPTPHVIPIPGRKADRSMSRTSAPGSAYGYSAGMRYRLAAVSAGRGSPYSYGSGAAFLRKRRNTGQTADGEEGAGEDLNLAQRLLLATEGNVTNMANLWVQAAINADNDDPFMDEESEGDEGDEEDDERTPRSEIPRRGDGDDDVFEDEEESIAARSQPASRRSSTGPTSRPSHGGVVSNRSPSHSQTRSNRRPSGGGFGFQGLHMTPNRPSHLAPASVTSRRPSTSTFASSAVPPSQYSHPNHSQGRITPHHMGTRRGSMSSGHAHVYLPSIYANTGLTAPPALALYDHLQMNQEIHDESEENLNSPGLHGPHTHATSPLGKNVMQGRADSPLSAIQESQRSSLIGSSEGGSTLVLATPAEPSMWSQLPVIIIFQYGLLALHNTVHDQYFLSYLVSPYTTGGLGLNAAHFAQLIALMCLAQIFYQFYLYPNLGPPRGRWSHLAMFRIGCALFIPSYLSVVLYRVFASPNEDGNGLVMTFLALSTALRYCGTTFAYTAISILLNYMSPPHLVSMSNSLAQSTVALARFLGPIGGGYLWSASVKGNPGGYPYGFYVVSIACLIGVLHSFTIR